MLEMTVSHDVWDAMMNQAFDEKELVICPSGLCGKKSRITVTIPSGIPGGAVATFEACGHRTRVLPPLPEGE